MKIALLSGASSIHTIRWANGLNAAGHEVHVISQHPELEAFGTGVTVHLYPFRGVLGYFTMVPAVRKLLQQIKPDIVNAHYASGYGTTGRLVGYRPWLLSVWGSDVYDVPYKSPFHRWLVKKNLLAADAVASTSHCMAQQIRKLTPIIGDIAVTPFGVDMHAYPGIEAGKPLGPSQLEQLVIGTVKTMSPKYGIDTLLDAFALVRKILKADGNPIADRVSLRLVGGGPQMGELKAQAHHLRIADAVTFTGQVPHQKVPQELAKLDIYVALSRLDSESFGVAIIEAGAAGRAVVVSDAGGLPEVTLHGKTGLVVPRDNPQAAAEAILRLLRAPELRHQMGASGRQHVQENYSWPACIATMVGAYQTTIKYSYKE